MNWTIIVTGKFFIFPSREYSGGEGAVEIPDVSSGKSLRAEPLSGRWSNVLFRSD